MAIADFPYSFASQPIIDPTTGQPVLNATGGVLQDPASGNALSIADMNGNPITQITGNAYGMSQQFRSTQLAVLVKFGSVYVQAPSIEMFDLVQTSADAVTLAQSAQSLAQAAAAAAQAAAASAAGGGGGGGGVTAHSALSGLGNDDHLQYHTDARGDARYYTQAQVTTAIGNAVTSSSTADRNRANHSGTQLASSISDFTAAVQAVGTGSGGIADGSVTNAKLASGIDAAKVTTGTLPIAVVPVGTLAKMAPGSTYSVAYATAVAAANRAAIMGTRTDVFVRVYGQTVNDADVAWLATGDYSQIGA